MFRKLLFSALIMLLLGVFIGEGVVAKQQLEELQDDSIRILLIYSNKENGKSRNVQTLDMLVHHFTSNVVIVSDQEVSEDHFEHATHVFYYGEQKQQISELVLSKLHQFTGPVVVIGENLEQISSFKQFEQMGEVYINGVSEAGDDNSETHLTAIEPIKHIKEKAKQEILLYGHKGTEKFPLLINEGNRYYFAAYAIEDVIKNYFAEVLHEIVPNDHRHEYIAYLRLEDIHPMTDPKKLLEIGEYLNERDIPYILVVIPVYITPETGQRRYFSDSPELVEVLQHLQETGGTVIAHGYTHQYRDSETGEGFEFWDVENEQFITSIKPKENIKKVKSQDYFANDGDYTTYLEPLMKIEQEYIQSRLKDAVHELVSYDLYPLGFEAPHYTMSQQGYSLVANYFPNIFGQIQLSDEDWMQMDAPPFLTTSQSVHGMAIYPETIGYVDPSLINPFVETDRLVNNTLIVRDGMIGGFYHPYLGLQYLPELLAQYEKVPNLTWLDFKKTEQQVVTSKVRITSDGTGQIVVENNLSWWDGIVRKKTPTLFMDKLLWGVTLVVLVFVILFFLFSIYLRTQSKKRLFKERKTVG